MKILVFGKTGQLASTLFELQDDFKSAAFDLVFLGRDEIDFEYLDKLDDYFKEIKPDIVINAVGYTAVDKAEIESLKAYKVNAISLMEISKYCRKYNSALIHISTDYVFDGKKNKSYIESDEAYPLSVYGKSKLLGEKLIERFTNKYVIIRVSWVFSRYGKNFLNTIFEKCINNLNLNIVEDQIGGPTSTTQIVKIIKIFCKKIESNDNPWGIYHLSGEPHVSWYEFANNILSIILSKGLISSTSIKAINSDEFGSKAKRPKFSGLSNKKIKSVAKEINYDYEYYLEGLINEKVKK